MQSMRAEQMQRVGCSYADEREENADGAKRAGAPQR